MKPQQEHRFITTSATGEPPPPDTTPPVLSNATGTETGATTADGSVDTDEANGTLYWYVSESATPPSVANHKDGTGAVAFDNQAISGTGTQNISITGLTADTAYYVHYLQTDAAANDSNQDTSAEFTTESASPPAVIMECYFGGSAAETLLVNYAWEVGVDLQVGANTWIDPDAGSNGTFQITDPGIGDPANKVKSINDGTNQTTKARLVDIGEPVSQIDFSLWRVTNPTSSGPNLNFIGMMLRANAAKSEYYAAVIERTGTGGGLWFISIVRNDVVVATQAISLPTFSAIPTFEITDDGTTINLRYVDEDLNVSYNTSGEFDGNTYIGPVIYQWSGGANVAWDDIVVTDRGG